MQGLVPVGGVIRTGRPKCEHSTQCPAAATATHPARHIATGFDLGPGSEILCVPLSGEVRTLRAVELFVAQVVI
jgi:hypothetical protein